MAGEAACDCRVGAIAIAIVVGGGEERRAVVSFVVAALIV